MLNSVAVRPATVEEISREFWHCSSNSLRRTSEHPANRVSRLRNIGRLFPD